MHGILFDMDGVLLDAMPYHAEAFKRAFKNVIDLEIEKKDVFLLEGMPGDELTKQILKKYGYSDNDGDIAKSIEQMKKEIFHQIEESKPFEGVHDLIISLNSNNCLKAVVSGASYKEVESLLQKSGLLKGFDLVVTGDDLSEGKPRPQPFIYAMEKLGIQRSNTLVVENSPLGIESAINADMNYIVTLNNTPLSLEDFHNLPKDDKFISQKVFADTNAASSFILRWCKSYEN